MTIIPSTRPLRPRDKDDHYPTPAELCRAAIRTLPRPLAPRLVLDPGCGDGVWGWALLDQIDLHTQPAPQIVGVDTRDVQVPLGYTMLYHTDFVNCSGGIHENYDLILGNPPYRQAEAFIRKSLTLLTDGGTLLFLLRLAFLEGQERGDGLWRECPPMRVDVCARRPSFTGDRRTDATAYMVATWRKGWAGATTLGWLRWDYDQDTGMEMLL